MNKTDFNNTLFAERFTNSDVTEMVSWSVALTEALPR